MARPRRSSTTVGGGPPPSACPVLPPNHGAAIRRRHATYVPHPLTTMTTPNGPGPVAHPVRSRAVDATIVMGGRKATPLGRVSTREGKEVRARGAATSCARQPCCGTPRGLTAITHAAGQPAGLLCAACAAPKRCVPNANAVVTLPLHPTPRPSPPHHRPPHTHTHARARARARTHSVALEPTGCSLRSRR